MQQELMHQFFTRYNKARTRREKALAVYNALIVALPREQIADYLGEEGEAFLAFIRTLQNEDADVGTAVAREQDAPSEAYLAALVEKLTSLD